MKPAHLLRFISMAQPQTENRKTAGVLPAVFFLQFKAWLPIAY